MILNYFDAKLALSFLFFLILVMLQPYVSKRGGRKLQPLTHISSMIIMLIFSSTLQSLILAVYQFFQSHNSNIVRSVCSQHNFRTYFVVSYSLQHDKEHRSISIFVFLANLSLEAECLESLSREPCLFLHQTYYI